MQDDGHLYMTNNAATPQVGRRVKHPMRTSPLIRARNCGHVSAPDCRFESVGGHWPVLRCETSRFLTSGEQKRLPADGRHGPLGTVDCVTLTASVPLVTPLVWPGLLVYRIGGQANLQPPHHLSSIPHLTVGRNRRAKRPNLAPRM